MCGLDAASPLLSVSSQIRKALSTGMCRAAQQLRRSLAGILDQDETPVEVLKPGCAGAAPGGGGGGGGKHASAILPPAQLQLMLDRMIKMTAENKITKDNAWDLGFIDHMADLVKWVRQGGRAGRTACIA